MKIFSSLVDLNAQTTSHGVAFKKVFLTGHDTETDLTQFSFGALKTGEHISEHLHPTMEELFFFTSGDGNFQIGDEFFNVEKDSFARVPKNTTHSLTNSGPELLSFVYFGIATRDSNNS